jgi:hypothetical protein
MKGKDTAPRKNAVLKLFFTTNAITAINVISVVNALKKKFTNHRNVIAKTINAINVTKNRNTIIKTTDSMPHFRDQIQMPL